MYTVRKHMKSCWYAHNIIHYFKSIVYFLNNKLTVIIALNVYGGKDNMTKSVCLLCTVSFCIKLYSNKHLHITDKL